MERRPEQLQQYEQQVLRHLRRWLIEKELEVPTGSGYGYRILVDDVRLDTHLDEDVVVVLFRMQEGGPLHGFRMDAMEPLDSIDFVVFNSLSARDLEFQAEGWVSIILANLDEALLTHYRKRKLGPEGIIWV